MTPAPRRSVAPAPARAHAAWPGTYAPGDVIGGRYELETLIGLGGFGQVWLARSLALGSHVALKLFSRADGSRDEGNRFIEEARAAAQLEHPAIVRVFDYGETDEGDPFLVMERLHGESLEDMLERGPLHPTRAVQILLPIIDALQAAHTQGLVHRDIKPANLFLARPDPGLASVPDVAATQWLRPKVIDFGLAKRWREHDAKLTPCGVLVGTPAYMAPEHALGGCADARADIWSLCVVLYELVTGRLPFSADTQYGLFQAIVERAPAPVTEPVDPALVAIAMHGMAKTPSARWQSMFELGVALAHWLVAQQVEEDAAGASVRATWIEPRRMDALAPCVSTPSARASEQKTMASRRLRRRRRFATFASAALLIGTAVTVLIVTRSSSKTVEAAPQVARPAIRVVVAAADDRQERPKAIEEPKPTTAPVDPVPRPAVQPRRAASAVSVVRPARPRATARDPELGF